MTNSPDGHAHDHSSAFNSNRAAAALELEGRLAARLTDEAIALCADLFGTADIRVRRIADLGSGPGLATVSLAKAFGAATVVAVDRSPVMLSRTKDRAERLGLSARVETRAVDLNDDLCALGTFDLVWTAMAVHHVDHTVAALRRIGAALRPHGLLSLIEQAAPTAVHLTDDFGRPGIWVRVQRAWSKWSQHAPPALPGAPDLASYPSMLEEAGLALVDSRILTSRTLAPDEPAMHAFVAGYVKRAAHNLGGSLDPHDLKALREHAEDLPQPEGATITTSRALLIVRQNGENA